MQENTAELPGLVEETSAVYLGKWNRLISTTNWDKGRIICQWRQDLSAASAPPASYTDDAWSQRVGRVSPQHVGRLRRVYERFADSVEQYPGLYWTHFQAALDWSDAEMWLEGAMQNQWSVSQMRQQRWETLGAVAADRPQESDVVAAEYDEDAAADEHNATIVDAQPVEVQAPPATAGDFDNLSTELDDVEESHTADADDPLNHDEPVAVVDPVRPFENLSALPADVNEAFERFKLVLLGHKLAGWKAMSCQQALAVLDGLKQMLLAPSDAPF